MLRVQWVRQKTVRPMGRLKGLQRVIDFAIDYGSIALMTALAVLFLWGSLIEPLYNPPRYRDGLGVAAIFGAGCAALAVKLWTDVRRERRRER